MPRIKFKDGTPAAMVEAVTPWLSLLEVLIPPWIYDVTFGEATDSPEKGDVLSVDTNVSYHFSFISIYPAFLTSSPQERRVLLQHEFIHMHLEHLVNFAQDLVEEFVGSPSDRLLKKEIRHRLEFTVEDINQMLERVWTQK